jgi:hypothetical protein
MVLINQLPDGISIEVRAPLIARFLGSGFLCVWLTGWAVGEAFVLTRLGTGASALLGKLVAGEADRLFGMTVTKALLVGLFLAVWLALWTLGGVAAMHRLAQLLWGVETIQVGGGNLRVVRRAWPFNSTREIPLDRVRRVDGNGRALVIETTDEPEWLFEVGTRADRLAALEALQPWLPRAEGGARTLYLPKGWLIREDGASGDLVVGRELRSRRFAGTVLGAIAALLGTATAFAFVEIESPWIGTILAAFTAVVLWGAVRGFLAEVTFHFRGNRAERRIVFLGRMRSVVIEPSTLELEQSSDSDGNICYTLSLNGPGRKIRLERRMNGSGSLESLGEFIQTRAGHPFVKWGEGGS